MTFSDPPNGDTGSEGRPIPTGRRIRVPDPSRIAAARRAVGDGFELPRPYPEPLSEFATLYRSTDKLPQTEYAKLVAKPKDQFRMMPLKLMRALELASPDAKLVFYALYHQHEAKHCRANGLLHGSTDYLQEKTGIGRRISVSTAIIELECRGLVRVQRGHGGRGGRALPSMFLLTAFPDCLGNPPTCDYEHAGLPAESAKSNSEEARADETREIAARFNARIAAQIELTRLARSRFGEAV